jgi:hypothetical protein
MEHPHVTRSREAHAALVAGDIEPCWALMRDEFVNVNDIGAGPLAREPRSRGDDAVLGRVDGAVRGPRSPSPTVSVPADHLYVSVLG